MRLEIHIFLVAGLFLLHNYHCDGSTRKVENETEKTQNQRQRDKRRVDVMPKFPDGKQAPSTCSHFGKLGFRENGYCPLHDRGLREYTAYCDFTSEPGYAWTLIASFSRQFIRNGVGGAFQRKSLMEDAPLNQDSPNWVAFRYSKYRMESLKAHSSHMRFTCTEDGDFIGIKNYNDYARVSLQKLDPFTLNVQRGKCAKTEFVNIRNVSCSGCTVSYVQRTGIRSLHIDPWLSQDHCSYVGAAASALTGEDNFGYYNTFNPKFTCTKYAWSTTQIWLGSHLLPAR